MPFYSSSHRNRWRENNPNIIPQLSSLEIPTKKSLNLENYNLSNTNLSNSKFKSVFNLNSSLIKAILKRATIKDCKFEKANLTRAYSKNISIEKSKFN